MKKYILYPILALTSLYLCMLGLSFLFERLIHTKYGKKYNSVRERAGIYPITDFESVKEQYWIDLIQEDPKLTWKWILTNQDIASTTTYTNQEKASQTIHKSKTLYYGTHFLFWKNYYAGEIDIFTKPIAKDTFIELFVTYYSENVGSDPYFYTRLDTLYPNKYPFVDCGTSLLDLEEKGNITKSQADKILNDWHIKIK